MSDAFWAQLVTLLGTLGSAAVGWAAANAGKWSSRARARRAALGHVLTTLLEVRSQVHMLQELSELLSPLPDTGLRQSLVVMMTRMLPDLTALTEDYTKAIKVLAGEDPVLAYKFRYSPLVLSTLRSLQEFLASADSPPPNALAIMDGILHELASDGLTDAVKAVAKYHGKKTSNDLWDVMQKEPRRKAELRNLLVGRLQALVGEFPEEEQPEIRRLLEGWVEYKPLPLTTGGQEPSLPRR